MNIWFISDTHFNHTNIIKYCNRPYNNTTEMDSDIITKWNQTVNKDDIVWFLGDFAFFKRIPSGYEWVRNIIKSLNGKINFMIGNHDRRISKHIKFWYDLGFEKAYDLPVIFMDQYILSHKPLQRIPDGFKNIHGHIHNNSPDMNISHYNFNVSVEVIDYKPIKFEEVVERMNNYRIE